MGSSRAFSRNFAKAKDMRATGSASSSREGAKSSSKLSASFALPRRPVPRCSGNGSCPFQKLNPTVLMVKSAQDVASDDAAAALNGPAMWGKGQGSEKLSRDDWLVIGDRVAGAG